MKYSNYLKSMQAATLEDQVVYIYLIVIILLMLKDLKGDQ